MLFPNVQEAGRDGGLLQHRTGWQVDPSGDLACYLQSRRFAVDMARGVRVAAGDGVTDGLTRVVTAALVGAGVAA